MRIDKIRQVEYRGAFEHEGDFWEERLVRPIDIYPAYREEPRVFTRDESGSYRVQAVFLEVHTDEGVTGLSGPYGRHIADLIHSQCEPILLGKDPLANELIWDQLYRNAVHGRKGLTMHAISAVDAALWDLKGNGRMLPSTGSWEAQHRR